jgi:biopolymer transport protein ExbD
MGGAAPVQSGKKGKKDLDSELNLVPFIDLLSCLITFLLISAVWTQISAVNARATGNLQTDPPPPDPEDKTIPIRVMLTDRGYTLSLANQPVELPKISRNREDGTSYSGYDVKTLTDKLKAVLVQIPEQRAVTVAAEDTVTYESLIETIDQVSAAGLPEISVSPN